MDNAIHVLNTDLADELLVINAIYGDGTAKATHADANYTTVELLLPENLQSADTTTFYLRYPATYPFQPPSIIGSSPLHRTTDPVITNDIAYFRACFVTCHVPGVATLHETISEFLSLRGLRLQLTSEQAATLCQRSEPAVAALSNKLSALAEAVQNAGSRSTSPTNDLGFTPLVVDCGVCLEPSFTGLAARLPHCSHTFCSDCLQEGISNFLETRSEFRCCGRFIPNDIVAKFCDLPASDLSRYRDWTDESSSSNPTYCYERSCANFIPSYRITEGGARCRVCPRITCPRCKRQHHDGLVSAHTHDARQDLRDS